MNTKKSLFKILQKPVLIIILFVCLGCEKEPKELFLSGEKLWDAGKYQEASKKFSRILYEHPDSLYRDNALFRLGEINFLFFKDHQRAVGFFREIVQQKPESGLAYKAQSYIGSIYNSLENYDQAIIEYQRLANTFGARSDGDKTQMIMADIYLKKGDLEQAREEYKILIDQYPDSTLLDEAEYKLGNVLYALGKYEEARTVYQKLSKRGQTTPFYFDAEVEIARCLEEQEELDRAMKKYQELKKEAPDNEIIGQGIERVKKRMSEKKK